MALPEIKSTMTGGGAGVGGQGFNVARVLHSGYSELKIYRNGKADGGRTGRKRGSSSPDAIYILPIPKGFNDIFDNEWNPQELGPIAGGLGKMSGEGLADAAVGLGSNALRGGFEEAGYGGAAELGRETIAIGAGSIINPNTELSYKSPTLRTLQFSWVLVPTNAGLAGVIDGLVKEIRSTSYPEKGGAGNFTYPGEFEITIYGGRSHVLLASLPAACTSLQVGYDTEGSPYIHKDGKPVSTTINLTLQESRLLSRADIQRLYK